MPLSFFQPRFSRRKRHLLLLFIFSYIQISYAQKQIFSVDHFLSFQPTAYTSLEGAFLIIRDSLADRSKFQYARSLIPGYLIVKGAQSSDASTNDVIGFANTSWKLSGRLAAKDAEGLGSYFSGKSPRFIVGSPYLPSLLESLGEEGLDIVDVDARSGAAVVSVADQGTFTRLLNSEWITFVDVYDSKPEEETLNSTQNLSVNHIGWIHAKFPAYNGESLTVSVRERTVEKSDIDLAGRIIESPLEDASISFHANQMATVIAGGGNSSEESKGIAWGSRVSSASFDSNLPDPDQYFTDYNISVQNHSYGFEIENFYGAQARAFDLQCNALPQLVHVFSAGNKGEEISSNGTYTGIQGFASLTGNLKMAKNVLVVGAHYGDYTVDVRNSRGPAFDGRIKPDIVAFGPEGTSDGAAYASGIVLLLQDVFQKKYLTLPTSALVRLTLALTADDPGSPGPDYVTGFGILNGKNAFQLIDDERFVEKEIAQGEMQELVIDVPPGSRRLRVGLAWNDPAAESGSPLALVNDLDLQLTEMSTATTYFPWTLSGFPKADSLQLPARRRQDQINNIEIITIDNPSSGPFRINVAATKVTGSQKFAVAYMIDTAEYFDWTFPLSSDRIESGQEISIRWNTTWSGKSSMHASVNGGQFAEVLGDVEVDQEFVTWTVPPGINKIRFKMLISGKEYMSDEFLATPVVNFRVGYNCDQSAMLQWDRVPKVDNYILFNLQEQYLSPVLNGPDTSYSFTPGQLSDHFAIAPVVDGLMGRRSLTYNYKATGVRCYYRSFDAELGSGAIAKISLDLSTLFNVNRIVLEKKAGGVFSEIGEMISTDALRFEFMDDELSAGLTTYRASIHLNDGSIVYTDEDVLVYADESTYAVYPNPLTRQSEPLHILTDGSGVHFQLVDAQGKVVHESELIGTVFDLDLSGLPAGFYVYRFSRDSRISSTGKIVLN